MSECWFRFVKGAIPSAAWDFSWLYDWGNDWNFRRLDLLYIFDLLYLFDWVFGQGDRNVCFVKGRIQIEGQIVPLRKGYGGHLLLSFLDLYFFFGPKYLDLCYLGEEGVLVCGGGEYCSYKHSLSSWTGKETFFTVLTMSLSGSSSKEALGKKENDTHLSHLVSRLSSLNWLCLEDGKSLRLYSARRLGCPCRVL